MELPQVLFSRVPIKLAQKWLKISKIVGPSCFTHRGAAEYETMVGSKW